MDQCVGRIVQVHSGVNMGTPQKSVRQDQDWQHSAGSQWRKLDIPIFAGDDTFGWVNRLEKHFRLQDVSEVERI